MFGLQLSIGTYAKKTRNRVLKILSVAVTRFFRKKTRILHKSYKLMNRSSFRLNYGLNWYDDVSEFTT